MPTMVRQTTPPSKPEAVKTVRNEQEPAAVDKPKSNPPQRVDEGKSLELPMKVEPVSGSGAPGNISSMNVVPGYFDKMAYQDPEKALSATIRTLLQQHLAKSSPDDGSRTLLQQTLESLKSAADLTRYLQLRTVLEREMQGLVGSAPANGTWGGFDAGTLQGGFDPQGLGRNLDTTVYSKEVADLAKSLSLLSSQLWFFEQQMVAATRESQATYINGVLGDTILRNIDNGMKTGMPDQRAAPWDNWGPAGFTGESFQCAQV